jgi:hypothetical protein
MNRPRLLVTRAEPDASDTARLIADLGGEAVLLTTRREAAILEAAPARPDLLIATSPRAFRLGEAIPPDWLALPCLAVGGVTGEAARQAGFTDIRIAGGEAASLRPLLAPFAGKRAVYLAGEPRRPELEADAAAAPAATVVDPEFEQLKSVVPVDACAWLPAEKLSALYPDLAFELVQKVEPRISGYVWDSRCTYNAGVGTIEFAKDAPTHTVEIFVATPVSEAKALANLASRRETAASTTGFEPQPSLGENAYSTTPTGVGSLYFVKGGSEVQINVSDLETPSAAKIQKAIALAESL